jgi:hypothetical protein
MQANPHAVPSHVAVEFAGAEQGVQLVPHVSVLSSLTHVPPQSC